MLKTILIDDEANALQSLEWELLNLNDGIQILGKFTNPTDAIKFINENELDCIFLDIEMPNIDGFQLLEKLQNRDFSTVITTAYGEYALSAIKEHAIDYLLKPVNVEDLRITIQKVRKIKDEKAYQNKLENALHQFHPSSSRTERKISLSVDGKLVFLAPSEIIYCESDGNYCSIFLKNDKRIFVSKKLKEIEALLPAHLFYRIHHSYVINLQKVCEYVASDNCVVLEENKRIPVSRQKKSSFLDKL